MTADEIKAEIARLEPRVASLAERCRAASNAAQEKIQDAWKEADEARAAWYKPHKRLEDLRAALRVLEGKE